MDLSVCVALSASWRADFSRNGLQSTWCRLFAFSPISGLRLPKSSRILPIKVAVPTASRTRVPDLRPPRAAVENSANHSSSLADQISRLSVIGHHVVKQGLAGLGERRDAAISV